MKKSLAELKYNTDLRADIKTAVNDKPKARVHSREWQKILDGDPVEINPSVGYGYKIMSVEEWSARWKRNDDFPECLACGSKNTKEHHFTQVPTSPENCRDFSSCKLLFATVLLGGEAVLKPCKSELHIL